MLPGILLGLALFFVNAHACRVFLHAVGTVVPGSGWFVLTACIVAHVIVGVLIWTGCSRVVAGGYTAFWTTRLGRWLIGRVIGLTMIALLLKPAAFIAMGAVAIAGHVLIWLALPVPAVTQARWLLYGWYAITFMIAFS